MNRLQNQLWDWATRNAIRLGTVLVVTRVVAGATYRAITKGARRG